MAGGPRPAPAGMPDRSGEEEVTVDGVTYRRGEHVRLRPGKGGDPYDTMVDGRMATIERILFDVEDKLYFAVTIDDDPGQDLLRETGRFLFFFKGEVEPA